MSFEENELRKALEARSGEVTPEYRSRLKQALAGPRPAGNNWMAAVAVVVVTLLTATSVGVLVAARHSRPSGPVASASRVTSPTPTPLPVRGAAVQLSVASADVVWALVDYDALFLSTDQGDHWVKRSLPSDFGVRPSITFINESEGWLLAPGSPTTQCGQANAAIWHTTDGAATWNQLHTSGLDAAQCKEVIYFSDAGHGFISAWDDNHQPSVYYSPDGVAWKRFTLADPPDFKTLPGGFMLRVEWIKKVGDTFYLEAYGRQGAGTPYPDFPDRQYMYTSTSFGAWAWKQKVPSHELVLVTQQRWLEIDPPGQLDESLNGGQEMHPYQSDLRIDQTASPGQMLFADASVGYVSRGGTLQRTHDGGVHWSRITSPGGPVVIQSPSPSPSPIALPTSADLSAPSRDIVWALIAGSRLFVSTDRGQTWQERSMPTAPSGSVATEISFVDGTNGWLSTCANSTLLWKTTDGARSWRTVSSPFPADQCMLGLSFVDQLHGYISARYDYSPPAIYRTSDGGETWDGASIQNPPGFQAGQPGYSYAVLHITRFGNVYYLDAHGSSPGGDTGYVFESTDSGASWKYLVTTPVPPESLGFVTVTRWLLLIGSDGSGQETTDAGKTWHTYASGYSQAAPIAPQVVFGDASVGYATVRGGIERTVDGGMHWTAIQTPGVQQTG